MTGRLYVFIPQPRATAQTKSGINNIAALACGAPGANFGSRVKRVNRDFMIKQIKSCKAEIDRLLYENATVDKLDGEAEKLLVKIQFFQHERLIHLIVTMTMSILTVITICAIFVAGEASIPIVMLFLLFLGLTAAYIIHYYRLENGVQELYECYHRLISI